jgi:hypothetical protein
MPRTLSQANFRGWPSYHLRQGPLSLQVVPAVGGRLMGMAYGAEELCFIHPALEGKTYAGNSADWAALCGDWTFPLWGGGKTWIAPESAWPAQAPHRDLDSLAWAVNDVWCEDDSMGVTLQSPVCSQSGLQITRQLSLLAGGAQWTIEHTLTNCGVQPIACGIWDVLMLRRPAMAWVALPSAPTHGSAAVIALPGKPSVEDLTRSGILTRHAQTVQVRCDSAQEFKCGFESDSGWVAVDFEGPGLRYERHSDVSTNLAYAHGKPIEVFNAPRLPYFEVETHSPLVTLGPGHSTRYCIFESVRSRNNAGPAIF